jgi:anthranilate phosphoribosyltransferase
MVIASQKNQLVGVFNLELARMYAYLYQNTDVNFTILHSLDEVISLTSPKKTITSTMEGMLLPEDFGVSLLKQRKSKAEQQSKIWLICLSIFLEKELTEQCSLCQRWNGHCNRNKMYSFRRISNSERKFIIRKGLLSLKKLKN